MFRKDLPGDHLLVGVVLADGAIALVELDRSGSVLVLVLIHRVVLAGYGALAGLMLAGDDGRVGGHDERGQRFLRLLYFWG